jgi:hypothetical protein
VQGHRRGTCVGRGSRESKGARAAAKNAPSIPKTKGHRDTADHKPQEPATIRRPAAARKRRARTEGHQRAGQDPAVGRGIEAEATRPGQRVLREMGPQPPTGWRSGRHRGYEPKGQGSNPAGGARQRP